MDQKVAGLNPAGVTKLKLQEDFTIRKVLFFCFIKAHPIFHICTLLTLSLNLTIRK